MKQIKLDLSALILIFRFWSQDSTGIIAILNFVTIALRLSDFYRHFVRTPLVTATTLPSSSMEGTTIKLMYKIQIVGL